jgi:hypothetical protein
MSVVFANPTQALTYRKVEDYLTTSNLFRDALQVATGQPIFYVTYGSAIISVEVLAWEVHPWESDDLAIVKACSCVTVDSQVNAELMRYLLLENSRMRFGAFHLGNANEVVFAHSVLGGENMDLMELQTCILSVVTIADTYDDIIVEKFGGQRAVDRLM